MYPPITGPGQRKASALFCGLRTKNKKKEENTHIFQLEDNTLQARGQRQKHTHLLHTRQNKHDDNHDYEQGPMDGLKSVPDENISTA